MTKEELLAKVATVAAAAFATPVFAPDKSVVKGEVGDNDNTFSLGQITEPGKYLVHSVIGAKIETAEKREVNSIRVNCISEEGVPCAIYLGTFTRGTAAASAAKAGLLGTFGQVKAALKDKALIVDTIERSEPDANNRRQIKRLIYRVDNY